LVIKLTNFVFIKILNNHSIFVSLLNDNKSDFVLLDLIRDSLVRNPDVVMSIIGEQQRKSNIDFSIVTKSIKENKIDSAIAVINHELKRVGMLVSSEKLSEPVMIRN